MATPRPRTAVDEDASSILVRRVEHWTVALGAVGTLAAGLHWGWRTAVGVAVGALLSWLNYRWLKQGVISLTTISVEQARAGKVRVPKRLYVKFFGRFVLFLGVVCVILWRFDWLVGAILGGFLVIVAGVLAAMIAHLLQSMRRA